MRLALRWLSMRYATGLRTAMSAWTPLIVAFVVAAGLKVTIDFGAATRAWLAAGATKRALLLFASGAVIVAASRRVLRPMFRGEGSDLLNVLPIPMRTRFALDTFAVLLFLIPAIVAGAMIIGTLVAPVMIANAAIITASLHGRQQMAHGKRVPYELHWFLSKRMLPTIAGSLVCIGAAKLAIANNDVHSAAAIARVASLFASVAAMIVALETGRLDAEARPFRAIERTLPRTAQAALVRTTSMAMVFILPAASLAIALSPIAALIAVLAFAMLFLLGRLESPGAVAWAGSFTALLAALNPIVVLIAMSATILVLARSLDAREQSSDA